MVNTMRAIVVGSGPSKDFEKVRQFNGIKIACDKEYHSLVKEGVRIDYLVTLEDEEFVHYFLPPHQNPKPTVVITVKTVEAVQTMLGKQDFPIKIFSDKLIFVASNVGMVAWMYAWMKLGCKEIYLTGFDHLYPKEGYELLHHLWRDMFHEVWNDLCPKDVNTIVDGYEHEVHMKHQVSKDSLSLDRIDSQYPGFKDINNYMRYRRDRNEIFVRKLKEWQVD